MAILAFQKPDKVIMLEAGETVGRFEFRPLEPGYGQTIGNALRRILLASLEGFAISSIKVTGVDQEFQTIPGVIEGMQDIILNLKQVRFRQMVETVDSEVANIVISGQQEFTAEDISKGLSSFKVLNPELHICSLALQSCLTLCNPIDGSPPGSSVPGILQARTLEWVAISFSNAWK